MSITIMCPNLGCRSILRVPEKVRGKMVRCGQCGMTFTVPQKPDTPNATKASVSTTPAAGQ